MSEAYSILGNQNEWRRYAFETSETGIRDQRNRRAAAAVSARGAGAGGGMGSGSFASTLPRNLVIEGMLGFAGVTALRTMWPTKEGFAGVTALRTMWPTKEEEDGGRAAWTSRTGQKRLVEAWKNPNTEGGRRRGRGIRCTKSWNRLCNWSLWTKLMPAKEGGKGFTLRYVEEIVQLRVDRVEKVEAHVDSTDGEVNLLPNDYSHVKYLRAIIFLTASYALSISYQQHEDKDSVERGQSTPRIA